MSNAPTNGNGNGNGNGGVKITVEILFQLLRICSSFFIAAIFIIAGIAAAYYAAMTRPVELEVIRQAKNDERHDDSIAALQIGHTASQKQLAEVETQISAVKQLEFIRIAYEHKFLQILWKEQKGYELPDLPPFMPGSESWTH